MESEISCDFRMLKVGLIMSSWCSPYILVSSRFYPARCSTKFCPGRPTAWLIERGEECEGPSSLATSATSTSEPNHRPSITINQHIYLMLWKLKSSKIRELIVMQLKDAQSVLLGRLGRGMLSLHRTIVVPWPHMTPLAEPFSVILGCVHSGDSLVARYSSWIGLAQQVIYSSPGS